MGELIFITFDWVRASALPPGLLTSRKPDPKIICLTMSDSGNPVRRSDAFG